MAFNRWKYLLVAVVVIVVLFVAVSLLDIVIMILNFRFYSNGAFYVLFGVAGVFAAFMGYGYAIQLATRKNEFSRWSIIAVLITAGLLFFFFLSELEGGEYEIPFKVYGATIAISSLFFAKGKIEL
jgi:hypothetical protein